jgi:hypothetical protein
MQLCITCRCSSSSSSAAYNHYRPSARFLHDVVLHIEPFGFPEDPLVVTLAPYVSERCDDDTLGPENTVHK